MHGIMADKFGSYLKPGAPRALPPTPSAPVETYVPSLPAPPPVPTRSQLQAVVQPPLTQGDLAIKAAFAQIQADMNSARQALLTSNLEAGKKTQDAIAKSSGDLHS